MKLNDITKILKVLRTLGISKNSLAYFFIILILASLLIFQNLSKSKSDSNPEVRGTETVQGEFKVEKVVDGDTIEVVINGLPEKVRYIGINTPETVKPNSPVECFGKEASEFSKQLLSEKTVTLESDVQDRDKFGRLLRYVYLKDDLGKLVMVNKTLVEEGYAYAATYVPNVKYQEVFKTAEQNARENQKGLWKMCTDESAKN